MNYTKIKHFPLFLLLLLFNQIYADDWISEEARVVYETKRLEGKYLNLTKNKPSKNNLIKSLKKMFDGKTINLYAETSCALQLAKFYASKDQDFAKAAKECFSLNQYWGIRIDCIEIIEMTDSKLADKLAKEMLESDTYPTEAKLHILRLSFNRNKLYAYPYLKEGLLSNKEFTVNFAKMLLNTAKKFDGKIYNEKGEKINIKKMLGEVEEIIKKRESKNKETLTNEQNK